MNTLNKIALLTLLATSATIATVEAQTKPNIDPCSKKHNNCQIYVVTYSYYAYAESPEKAAEFAAQHLRSEEAITQPLPFTVFEGRRPSPVTILPPSPYQGGQ